MGTCGETDGWCPLCFARGERKTSQMIGEDDGGGAMASPASGTPTVALLGTTVRFWQNMGMKWSGQELDVLARRFGGYLCKQRRFGAVV